MKSISFCTLLACATTGATLLADYQNYDGQHLDGYDFTSSSLEGSSWVGANLTTARFDNATLTSADFTKAKLTNASFERVSATSANFTDADLSGADFYYYYPYLSDLSGTLFIRSNLTFVAFTYTTLTGVDFTDAVVNGANFAGSNISFSQLASTASYKSRNLADICLAATANLDLSDRDFSGFNLTSADLSQTNIEGSDFTGAVLRNADLYWSSGKNAYFTNADLDGADLGSANWTGAHFTNANLSKSWLNDGVWEGVYFTNADLSGANLARSTLARADFTHANLMSANLNASDLTGANFSDAVIAGVDFSGSNLTFSQLASTASYKTKDLCGVGLGGLVLSGWNFRGFNLESTIFNRSTLTESIFTDATIIGADFSGSRLTFSQLASTASYKTKDLCGVGLGGLVLSGENFSGFDLTSTTFNSSILRGCNFCDANFTYANLTSARLEYATLTGADFTDSLVNGANFSYSNLTFSQLASTASYKVKDLSSIRLDYLDLSNGNFSGFDLTSATFNSSTLTGCDFRGAVGFLLNENHHGTNIIAPDGTIERFSLEYGDVLRIRACETSAKLGEVHSSSEILSLYSIQGTLSLDGGATLDLLADTAVTIGSDGRMVLNGGRINLEGLLVNKGTMDITVQSAGKNAGILVGDSAILASYGTILIRSGSLDTGESLIIFSDKSGVPVALAGGTIKAFGGIYSDGVFTAGENVKVLASGAIGVEVCAGASITITDSEHMNVEGVKHAVSLSATASIVVESTTNLDIAEIVLDGKSYEIGASWDFSIRKDDVTEVLVTMHVGSGLSETAIKVFHCNASGDWMDYTNEVNCLTYDSESGSLSFIAKEFSSYAATGTYSSIAVPEPSMFSLFVAWGVFTFAVFRRKRK